jgi:hypothetical protein
VVHARRVAAGFENGFGFLFMQPAANLKMATGKVLPARLLDMGHPTAAKNGTSPCCSR